MTETLSGGDVAGTGSSICRAGDTWMHPCVLHSHGWPLFVARLGAWEHE